MRDLVCKLPILFLLQHALFAVEPTNSSRQPKTAASFQVRSYPNGPSAQQLLERCERLRLQLRRVWLNAEAENVWEPRCEVVVHRMRTDYMQAVGRGAGQTSGASLIRFEHGRVIARRLDLLVDQRGNLPALAHELKHVVLADHFGGRQPPRWVDEGVATMADAVEKRLLHHRDCHSALRDGTALRVVEILKLEEFTSPRQVAAFYGQSLSLVSFLVQREEPSRLLDFADATMEIGYDRALRKYYGINGVNAFEQQWQEHLAGSRPEDSRNSISAVTYLP